MEETEVIYRGSANRLPKYNLYDFKDGDVLKLPKDIAERLVEENIGFSFAKSNEENGKKKKKKEGE